MKRDLEDYRSMDMSSFQKVNHFFISFISDPVFYYVNCKKSYSLGEAFEKSASRDFLLRQLKIQIEDHLLPSCPEKLKSSDYEVIE
jgi:hypothetical protein